MVVGASIDHAEVGFSATGELAALQPDLRAVGTGILIDQPDGTIAPVRLNTTSLYIGLYARDTLNLTSRLAVTAGEDGVEADRGPVAAFGSTLDARGYTLAD